MKVVDKNIPFKNDCKNVAVNNLKDLIYSWGYEILAPTDDIGIINYYEPVVVLKNNHNQWGIIKLRYGTPPGMKYYLEHISDFIYIC